MLDLVPDRLGHMCVMSHTTMQRLLEPLRAEQEAAAAAAASAIDASAGSSHPRAWLPSTTVPLTRPIPIEVCPTSNSLTLSLPGLRHHPTLAPWLQLGYPFAICTDDSTVFGVTLSSEYATVAKEFDLSRAALADLALRAFDFAFLPAEQRAALKAAAADKVRVLLASHDGADAPAAGLADEKA